MAKMVKNLGCRKPEFDPWVQKIPWRRAWQPTLVFLPGESHGQKSLEGYLRLQRVGDDSATNTQLLRQLSSRNFFCWTPLLVSRSNKDLIYSAGNYSILCNDLYGKESKKEGICVYIN